jgi:DNA-directed RNA polymerase specialized sigma24 family protein
VAGLAETSRRPRVAAGPEDDRPDELLWTRVAALPERQRTAVVLKYVADLDHPTIARVLDTSPAMSRRLVSDALSTLRKVCP